MLVHNDHIVKDVAKELLVQGFVGTWGNLTHEMTTRGGSRRLEKGSFAGISMLTSGLPPKKQTNETIGEDQEVRIAEYLKKGK